MSCDWDVECADCGIRCGISGANHMQDLAEALVAHAAELARAAEGNRGGRHVFRSRDPEGRRLGGEQDGPRRFSGREVLMRWSGCNYWVNQGGHPLEPVGTATSMHGCDGCEHDGSCPLQKECEVWPHDASHDDLATRTVREFAGSGKKVEDDAISS